MSMEASSAAVSQKIERRVSIEIADYLEALDSGVARGRGGGMRR